MAESLDSIPEPIPISLIAGRYLLFDINVVTYLRRTHHICGVLLGSIPQIPQQNVFLGLPVELMPEEAKVLVEKEVAYIVDDFAWHKQKFNTFGESDRRKYLDSLRSEGSKARRAAEAESRKKTDKAVAKLAARRAPYQPAEGSAMQGPRLFNDNPEHGALDSPFTYERSTSPVPSSGSTSNAPYAVTPTTTYSPSSLPQNPSQQPDPLVPSSYPLFAHLHSRDYFIMPGLRFGCDYNVYPGDPLRFHSHFTAINYNWDEEISMLDLIGGGRLGTRVKKGFLIGGKDSNGNTEDGDCVRTFCIEWGGM